VIGFSIRDARFFAAPFSWTGVQRRSRRSKYPDVVWCGDLITYQSTLQKKNYTLPSATIQRYRISAILQTPTALSPYPPKEAYNTGCSRNSTDLSFLSKNLEVANVMFRARPLLRTSFSALIICCIMLLSACGTAKSTTTLSSKSTPEPSPTPTANLTKAFTSSDGIYTINYPLSWEVNPLDQGKLGDITIINGIEINSSTDQDYLVILPTDQTIKDENLRPFLSQFLLTLGMADVAVSSSGTKQQIGTNTWNIYTATGDNPNTEDEYEALGFFITHNGKTFIVIAMAFISNFQLVGTSYFDPALTSLKFLK
jgi:hypothetical protein